MSKLLTLLVASPFLGAALVALIPRNFQFVIRLIALLSTAISMALSIYLFAVFQPGFGAEVHYQHKVPWVESLGINYYVGVDGLNVGLVLMAAIVGFAATAVCWEIRERVKEFYFLLLIMTGGIIGAFASLDLFFFFVFHELALIPTFIMIGVWGRGEQKNYATFKMTLYLTLGALIALVGLIALYLQSGAKTFDIVALTKHVRANPIGLGTQHLIFPWLLFGFGILVSLWPFHTWAPIGYGAAPTATAMLHAGVLKKFGLYGLIRIAIPLLPDAAQSWMNIIAVLCLGNILFVGWVAMRQKDLNLLIGNSSVAHMGFVFLGIASFNLIGLTGAVVVMVAHGFLAALTFALSGYLYNKGGQLTLSEMGGYLKRMPFVGAVLVMAMMAGCGLPGFANFVGELMVFFSAFKKFPVATALALWGALVIGAIYMLRAIRSILHGPAPEGHPGLIDAGAIEPDSWMPAAIFHWGWRKLPFALLLSALLLFGFYPGLLTEKAKHSAQQILDVAARVPEKPVTPPRPPPNMRKQASTNPGR
ncbi:MAG: NADH-quinone oxidoreductase subunit M [Verrucomicrobiota bacterium]